MIPSRMKRFIYSRWGKAGMDPSIFPHHLSPVRKAFDGVSEIRGARIIEVLPEPQYEHVYVNVEYMTGGKAYNVKWPGPNFEVTQGGSRGSAKMMHGIYVGPKVGQLVSIGYENGRYNKPIILNVYPHEHDKDTRYEDNHLAPMVQMGFSIEDIAIAHYSGSYVALRSDLNPGDIEINSVASVNIDADSTVNIVSQAEIEIDATSIYLGDKNLAQPILKGDDTVVELEKIKSMLSNLQSSFASWVPVPNDGGASLKLILTLPGTGFTTYPLPDYSAIKSQKSNTE